MQKKIREDTSAIIKGYMKDKSLDQIIEDINLNKLQRAVFHKVQKLYPIRAVEIRKIEVTPIKAM